MIHLFVLLAAISSLVLAKQSCYSCTNAVNVDILNGWNWGSMIPSPPPSDMKFGSQFCDLYPEASVDVVNNCTSMCFVWQYNYTDPSGNPAYETIRGCASDIPNMNVPSTDGCPSYLQPSPGGQGYPGGPNAAPGKYSMCFCTGDFCNSCNGNDCLSNPSSSSTTTTISTTVGTTAAAPTTATSWPSSTSTSATNNTIVTSAAAAPASTSSPSSLSSATTIITTPTLSTNTTTSTAATFQSTIPTVFLFTTFTFFATYVIVILE